MRRTLTLIVLWALAGTALAIDTLPPLADPELQARYEKLADELRCLVCQNQTIGDSNAELAVDLRGQVRRMLEEGASDQEILDYMVARYGNFVRYRPPLEPATAALWVGPVLLMLTGAGVAAAVILRRSRLPLEDDLPPEQAES